MKQPMTYGFTSREYGGYDSLVAVTGPICVRYQRVAGKPEEWAGFTEDGRQITEFSHTHPVDKQFLLPWVEELMKARTP